jgi:hypothetical protein
MEHCGKCHVCGSPLKNCLDGEQYCQEHGYQRYKSHGWSTSNPYIDDERGSCPDGPDAEVE